MATESSTRCRAPTPARAPHASCARPKQVPGVIYGHRREPQSLALDARDLRSCSTASRPTARCSSSDRRHDVAHADPRDPAPPVQARDHPRRFPGARGRRERDGRRPGRARGHAGGVRHSGGMLDQMLRTISVEVDPANIPNHIDVDVTNLDLHQSIHVRDLSSPRASKFSRTRARRSASCAPPRAEVEVAPAAAEGAEPGAEPE